MMKLKRRQLAKYLDHTMLKPEATATMIDQTVAEAIKYQTASVCINPYWVKRVHQKLSETGINTCTVIGFHSVLLQRQVKFLKLNKRLEMVRMN